MKKKNEKAHGRYFLGDLRLLGKLEELAGMPMTAQE